MAERRPDRTLGPAHDEFWKWCNRGELRLQHCVRCNHFCWPVLSACEHCGSKEFAWVPMSGRGKIVSWCTFERDYYQGALPIPWDNILVELEEGPLFLSNPHGFVCRDVAAGMPVKVAFIECEDSAGTFNLPVFVRSE
jgi:uncharacterized protein